MTAHSRARSSIGGATDEVVRAIGVVGVLGGMGPSATVDFMRKMLEATSAATDQEHVPIIVSFIPQIPDRTEAFRGAGASPLADMVSSGRRLSAAGAGLVVIPCNTAHLWFDEIRQALCLPMLHIVDAALEDVVKRAGATGRIGLLATDATLASGLYLKRGAPRGHAHRVQWFLPTPTEVLKFVTLGIAAVKGGHLQLGTELLLTATRALKARGASAVVLGCTEIPVVIDGGNSPLPVIDATASLARRAVAWSREQQQKRVG